MWPALAWLAWKESTAGDLDSGRERSASELVVPAVRLLEERLAESTGSEAIFVRFRLESTRAVVDFIDGLLAERSGIAAAKSV